MLKVISAEMSKETKSSVEVQNRAGTEVTEINFSNVLHKTSCVAVPAGTARDVACYVSTR